MLALNLSDYVHIYLSLINYWNRRLHVVMSRAEILNEEVTITIIIIYSFNISFFIVIALHVRISILRWVSVLKRKVKRFTSHEMCFEWHQINWNCMFRCSLNHQFSTPFVVHANHRNQMWNDAWLDESFHSILNSDLSPNKLIPNLMDLIIGVDVLQLRINVFAKKSS